jgi:hypothetical protein
MADPAEYTDQYLHTYTPVPATGPSTDLLAMQVAAIIARFAATHLLCVSLLLGGQPDLVTSVPSTRIQPLRSRHPPETAITRVSALAALHVPDWNENSRRV